MHSLEQLIHLPRCVNTSFFRAATGAPLGFAAMESLILTAGEMHGNPIKLSQIHFIEQNMERLNQRRYSISNQLDHLRIAENGKVCFQKKMFAS